MRAAYPNQGWPRIRTHQKQGPLINQPQRLLGQKLGAHRAEIRAEIGQKRANISKFYIALIISFDVAFHFNADYLTTTIHLRRHYRLLLCQICK